MNARRSFLLKMWRGFLGLLGTIVGRRAEASGYYNMGGFMRSPPSAGGLWGWGQNAYGQLGQGDTVSRSSPVQIGSVQNWTQVTGGYAVAAIKADGTLWSWGRNLNGELGLGTTVNQSAPVQVGNGNNWMQVWMDSYSSGTVCAAVRTDGTLWTWGNGTTGALGLNSVASYSSPMQVGSLSNWAQVTVDGQCLLAVKSDGTMWACGQNSIYGTLGLNSVINKSSPVQIGALTTWAQVSTYFFCSFARKTDGTIWVCGANGSGDLGINSVVNRSAFVQTGTVTNWLATGLSHAIRSDGTLWGWGYNSGGRLGNGNTVRLSSAVQIGSFTTWAKFSASGCSLGIQAGGTLWGWGSNNVGEIGVGDTVGRSSPVQIGSASNWVGVHAGQNQSFGIRS